MIIQTKIGFGAKVTGEISLGKLEPGKIVICLENVGREFSEKAGLVGVTGVVLPSIHWRDYEYFKKLNEFPILVLLKFGRLECPGDLIDKLTKLDDKKAVLDGEAHELKLN